VTARELDNPIQMLRVTVNDLEMKGFWEALHLGFIKLCCLASQPRLAVFLSQSRMRICPGRTRSIVRSEYLRTYFPRVSSRFGQHTARCEGRSRHPTREFPVLLSDGVCQPRTRNMSARIPGRCLMLPAAPWHPLHVLKDSINTRV